MARLSIRNACFKSAAGAVLCFLSFGSILCAEERISDLEAATDRWIELKIKASQERSDWKSERVLLESTIRSLESEQELLTEEVASNELAADLYSKNRDRLASMIENKTTALSTLRGRLQEFEARLKALLPSLPEPLARDIRPLVGKLGKTIDDQPVSIATRVQSLVTLLTTIDQFNNSLTVTHQLRQASDGSEFDTRVLYWGLAFGYAVDATGTRAWRLTPGEEGWQWQESPEIAAELVALIDIYERNRQPEMLALPVSLAKGGSQ